MPSTRNPFLVENPIRIKRWAPKVSKGRSESPLVASAEAKPRAKEKPLSPQKDIVKALTARSQGFCNYFPLSSSAFTLGTSAISVALRGGNSGFISVSVSRRISLTR